jgi:hypothetical protein
LRAEIVQFVVIDTSWKLGRGESRRIRLHKLSRSEKGKRYDFSRAQ